MTSSADAAVRGDAASRGETQSTRRRALRTSFTRPLRIPNRAVDFGVRGFAPCAPAVRARLEGHGRAFAYGFNSAAAVPVGDGLDRRLEAVEPSRRGFAFEGAAMALACLDLFVPGRSRVERLLRGSGSAHVYMVHVGAGWALARLRRRSWGRLRLDPLLRWLALDGFGFHDAFFHPGRVVRMRRVPRRLDSGAARIFDQGVGRALWFVEGAEPERIARTVALFEQRRRGDLWSGVGLAAAYAGGADAARLERLVALGCGYEAHIAQGAAFAAQARLHAGNLEPATDRACEALCGVSVAVAGRVTHDALAATARDGSAADYERWRGAIRARFGGGA